MIDLERQLPEGWIWQPLKRVTTRLSRGTAPDYVDDGPVHAVSQAVNQEYGLDWSRGKFHDYSGDPKNLKGHLEHRDTLVNSTGTGTLGRAGFFDGSPDSRPCVADGHVTVVRTRSEMVDPRFAYYWLSSSPFYDLIYSALTVGSTNQIELSREKLSAAPIPVPSLEEQRRIADFLDREVVGIDSLYDKIKSASGLAVERSRSLVDHELDRLGENWSVPVSSVCARIVDCINKTAPVSDEETQFRMIRTSNVRDGYVDMRGAFYVTKEIFRLWSQRGRPKRGDILLAREAPLGQVGKIDFDGPAIMGQRLMLYRANHEIMDPDFLLFNFLGSRVEKQFRLLGSGSLHEHMRVSDGLKLRVLCPPISKQRELVNRIRDGRASCSELVESLGRQLSLLTERRQALITAAVTGQIDVTTARGADVS